MSTTVIKTRKHHGSCWQQKSWSIEDVDGCDNASQVFCLEYRNSIVGWKGGRNKVSLQGPAVRNSSYTRTIANAAHG